MLKDEIIEKWIKLYNCSQIFVAYSGGVDSTALLYLTTRIPGIKISAVHVNHSLSPESHLWENHCINFARSLKIRLLRVKLDPPIKASNIENWARDERYSYFSKIVLKNARSLLFTAHHIDDQVETFLLQSLRGSGLNGLSGIPEDRKINNSRLIRPFLHVKKKIIRDYCEFNQLEWIEDNTNQENKYKRNAIRNLIIPKINLINNSEGIAKSAKWCKEANSVLSEYLEKDLKKILISENILESKKIKKYSFEKKKHLIRYWLKKFHQMTITSSMTEEIIKCLNSNVSNKIWSIKEKIVYIDFLTVCITSHKIFFCNDVKDNNKVLEWLKKNNLLIKQEEIIIRKRKSSDRCKYQGRKHNQRLKILFQELKINSYERKKAKIICYKKSPEKIIAIYPFFSC